MGAPGAALRRMGKTCVCGIWSPEFAAACSRRRSASSGLREPQRKTVQGFTVYEHLPTAKVKELFGEFSFTNLAGGWIEINSG